ncbi:MAG: CRTAC1 family protein [Candidatus Hinthialibacter antarcticus]|nr:CRTAC1 family protein [Candidatus Hinthialibacter antarcticus]
MKSILLPLIALVLFASTSLAQDVFPQFTDATESAGIHFKHSIGDEKLDNIIESTGAGCAFFDYNNDGQLDIYLVNGSYLAGINSIRGRNQQGKLKNALYHNNGDGTFRDVSEAAGVADTGFGMGCVTGDYDNDGDADLFVTNYGPDVLYQNNGDGTFSNVTQQAGVEDDRWGIGASFFDYDKDGDLDLYVGAYILWDPEYNYYYAPDKFPGPLSYPGQQDALYRNNDDGTFTDVTEAAGLTNPDGRAMGVATCDIDNDGWVDIFVANDAMGNYLYRNLGDGTFEDIALLTATAFGQNGEAQAAMGPEFGDFNLDGFLDLLVPDMTYCCLYRNTGDGWFEEMSNKAGVAASCGQYTSWSGNFLDFNHDGWIDIFLSNGDSHKLDAEEDLILLNQGGERFEDVSARLGAAMQDKFVSRGSAVGDYDGDGDLDLLIVNLNNRCRLLRNDGASNTPWLQIKLQGTKSNRDAYGAVVQVTAGGKTQTRYITSSSGYLSQSQQAAHFGLGENKSAERVDIQWPSGEKQSFENVDANQVLTIKEPQQ